MYVARHCWFPGFKCLLFPEDKLESAPSFSVSLPLNCVFMKYLSCLLTKDIQQELGGPLLGLEFIWREEHVYFHILLVYIVLSVEGSVLTSMFKTVPWALDNFFIVLSLAFHLRVGIVTCFATFLDCKLLADKGSGMYSCIVLESTVTVLELLSDNLVDQIAVSFSVSSLTKEAYLDTGLSWGNISNYEFQWRIFWKNFSAEAKLVRKLTSLRYFQPWCE